MSQGQYVALAYGVVFVFVLLWVAIIATKLARLERETGELAELARGRRPMGELLVWPALIAYGEAAVAYAGVFRGTRVDPTRLAIWGVRIGWLAQTALLVAQALDSDGFPGERGRARSTCSSGSSSART